MSRAKSLEPREGVHRYSMRCLHCENDTTYVVDESEMVTAARFALLVTQNYSQTRFQWCDHCQNQTAQHATAYCTAKKE